MKIQTTKKFDKNLSKIPKKIKEIFKLKVDIFIKNPFDVRLNNHKLQGPLYSYRSINITGDYRLIYEVIEESEIVLFLDINIHSELYK